MELVDDFQSGAGKLRALGEPLRNGAATLAQAMAPTAQVIRVKAPKNGDGWNLAALGRVKSWSCLYHQVVILRPCNFAGTYSTHKTRPKLLLFSRPARYYQLGHCTWDPGFQCLARPGGFSFLVLVSWGSQPSHSFWPMAGEHKHKYKHGLYLVTGTTFCCAPAPQKSWRGDFCSQFCLTQSSTFNPPPKPHRITDLSHWKMNFMEFCQETMTGCQPWRR